MADTQQHVKQAITDGGVRELVILVGILLTVIAGAIGTYWMRSKGVEAAGASAAVVKTPAGEPSHPRVTVPAPPAGVFHTDVYFDFKSARLRADAARVLQETAGSIDLSTAWVVLVQGYADRQGPAEYNRLLAQRRAESVKQFLVELGVPESAIRLMTMGREATLCEEPSKECQQLNRRVHLEFRKLAAGVSTGPTAAVTSTASPAQSTPASAAGDR
jgi:outer membrane protein OmpA-like peptidoglycan-associated protein